MAIWYNLCYFGTFFRFWYHEPKKSGSPVWDLSFLCLPAGCCRHGAHFRSGVASQKAVGACELLIKRLGQEIE
jgi:hypothetical protein